MLSLAGISIRVRFANGGELPLLDSMVEDNTLRASLRVPAGGLDSPFEVVATTSRVGKRYAARVNFAGADLELRDFAYNSGTVFKSYPDSTPMKTQPNDDQFADLFVMVTEWPRPEIVACFKVTLVADRREAPKKQPKAPKVTKKPPTKRATKPNRRMTGRGRRR